jgi:hypothetical protein
MAQRVPVTIVLAGGYEQNIEEAEARHWVLPRTSAGERSAWRRAPAAGRPLDMPLNQASIVQIESGGARETTDEPALAWLAANAIENDGLPADLADRHDHYLYGGATEDR